MVQMQVTVPRHEYVLFWRRMKSPLALFVECFLLAGTCWIAWGIYRNEELQKGFNDINPGHTESQVLRALGRPKRVERCGEFMGPLPKAELEGCVREFFYASPFSPLLPQYYVVRFNNQGTVSSTTPYSSP